MGLLLPVLIAWPAGVLVLVGAGWYASSTSGFTAKRAEVPSNVDGLKTAQLGYDAAFDTHLATPVWPRPVEELDQKLHSWGEAPEAYQMLGWSPDGDVRGTYQVVTVARTEGPYPRVDFVVHGWIDADGDGEVAHYTATRTTNATMLSDSDVR